MATPLTTRPPEGTLIAEWVLDSVAQLRQLRAGLHHTLTGADPAPGQQLADIPDKMAMVATELATNALKYGRPPTIVQLRRCGEHFVLDIADHDTGALPQVADDRPLGAGGLGLVLALKLAVTVGWYVADTTKHVWAQFPTAGPHAVADGSDS